jgi:hypothetical protein
MIIMARQQERVVEAYRAPDDDDCFPMFTCRIRLNEYPDHFKPVSINKYNDKQAPQQWLWSLTPDSIDSWDDLKRAFIDNFQGSIQRAGTRHDLA